MIDARRTIRQILGIIVSLVILAVGIYAFQITISTINDTVDTSYTESFVVTDATVDQLLNTNERSLLESIVVTQYDGVSWTTVPAANVSYSDTVITVEHGGLVWRIEG